MAVRKLKEELNFDRSFTDVCKVYVNGKELDISGLDTYDQVGDVFAAECRRTPEFEEWIREYMNSLGDPLVDDSDSVEEVCRLFAKELDMDLHDSEPGEFYVDGSGIVYDSDVRVEIFEESVKRGRNKRSVAMARKSVSESKASKRRAKRVNEDFDDEYDDTDFTDAYAGYPGLQDAIDAMYRLNETLAKFSNAVDEMCKGSEYELFSGPDDAMAFADGANEIYRVLGELEDKFENLPGTPYIY